MNPTTPTPTAALNQIEAARICVIVESDVFELLRDYSPGELRARLKTWAKRMKINAKLKH